MNENKPIINAANERKDYQGTIIEASGSQEWEKAELGITWYSASIMLINVAIGSSLLNMPFLYNQLGGFEYATIIQIVMLMMSATTMYVMCACSDLDDVDTYDEVIDYMCGRTVQKLSAVSVMITCFGICVTFLVVIGDQMDLIFATTHGPEFCQHWYLNRDFYIILVSLFFMWPLSCSGHIPNVLFANYIDTRDVEVKMFPHDTMRFLSALPVMGFSYQTHVNLIPIYGSLRDRSLKNMTKSISLAVAVIVTMYTFVGVAGYLTFGDKVRADILQMYDPSDPFVCLAIIAFVIKMIETYPQVLFCCKQSYNSLIGSDPDDQGGCRRFSTSGVMNMLILFFALIVPNLSLSLKYIGSLSACSSFIIPGICMATLANSQDATIVWSRLSCIALFICGIFVSTFGLILLMINFIISSDDSATASLCNK